MKKLCLIIFCLISLNSFAQTTPWATTAVTWQTRKFNSGNELRGLWNASIVFNILDTIKKYGAGTDFVRKDYIFTDSHPVQLGDTVNSKSLLFVDPAHSTSYLNAFNPTLTYGGQLYADSTQASLNFFYPGGGKNIQVIGQYSPILIGDNNNYGMAYADHPSFYSDLQIPDIRRVDSAITAHTSSLPFWALSGSSNLTGTTNILTGAYTLNIGSTHAAFSLSANDTTTASIVNRVGDTFTGRSTQIGQTKDLAVLTRLARFGTGFKYQGFFAGSQGDATVNKIGIKDDFNHAGAQYFGVVDTSKMNDSTLVFRKWITARYGTGTGGTPNLQSVTTAGNTTTLQIQAKNYYASGTAGQGYLDLPSQSASPVSTTNRLKIYADSLNRLSWKNSTYRRTLQVPYPSDATIRMPYGPNPTLADSAKVDALVTSKISGAVVKKIDLVGGIGDSMTAGGQYLTRIVSDIGGTGWGFNTFGIAGDRTSGMLAKVGLTTSGNYNTVVVLGGVNDAFALIPAATIEANLQAIYTALHNSGAKVIASTILPCSGNVSWSASVQAIIVAVNTWIKTTAINVDAVSDNYVNMADPANATALNPTLDSGDHLHPSDPTGYNALGDFMYASTTFVKKNFVYNLNVGSDTRINQNLSTGDNVSFQRVNTSQLIVTNDRQYSTPWPAMATTLVTGVQTPTEAGAFYDTDKHLPGFYDGTSPRYLVWNGQATSLTINSDIIASSLYNSTSINNAYIQPSTSGVKVQRNVADAVAAFTSTQVNAGSTGNIQNWQFGGNVQAAMTYRGYLSIGASTTASLLNVQQSTQGTGTISNSASGTTVTGVGTIFTNTFSIGQTITANGETHTISAIASNTSMTTDAWTGANLGVAYTLVGGSRLTVDGNGIVKIPTFTTAGIVHNAVTTGALSSSLIATADIANAAVTAAKADTTALQTVANFFPKGDTRYAKSTTVTALGSPVKSLFTNTGTATVTNTTTATSIIPAGNGSMTPTTAPVAGTTYLVQLGGVYTVPVGAGNFTVTVAQGATTLATGTMNNFLGAGGTNLSIDGNFRITNLTIGASGTETISGGLSFSTGNNLAPTKLDLNNGGAVITKANTTAEAITVTVAWATASTSRSFTINQFSLDQKH